MYKYIHFTYFTLLSPFKSFRRVGKKLGIVDILGVDKLGIDDMAPNWLGQYPFEGLGPESCSYPTECPVIRPRK